MNENNIKPLGWLSAKYESGKDGAAAISKDPRDPGGASYGIFQFSSKAGTLQSFLRESGYGQDFDGLIPGTSLFDSKWRQLAMNNDFAVAQTNYIATHLYQPVRDEATQMGIVDHPAINEAIFSMAVQHGAAKMLVKTASMALPHEYTTDQCINQLYSTRASYVKHLALNPSLQAELLNRFYYERRDCVAYYNELGD